LSPGCGINHVSHGGRPGRERARALRGQQTPRSSRPDRHWVTTVAIWAVTLALVLERFGVPFASLIAPLTAGGVALGLGAQRLVLDLLTGAFIITERQYGYGDLVHISATTMTDGVTGTVEELTLRVTRLRTAEGERVVISNGQVLQVTNLSSDWARATVNVGPE
jgi:moderate conductance mechanosensitive channel